VGQKVPPSKQSSRCLRKIAIAASEEIKSANRNSSERLVSSGGEGSRRNGMMLHSAGNSVCRALHPQP
jgi:hypothetical protein